MACCVCCMYMCTMVYINSISFGVRRAIKNTPPFALQAGEWIQTLPSYHVHSHCPTAQASFSSFSILFPSLSIPLPPSTSPPTSRVPIPVLVSRTPFPAAAACPSQCTNH